MQRLPGGDHRAARVQRLLLRLAEDVRLLLPLDAQLVRVRRELVGGEQLLGAVVVERDPFEAEEDERVLDLGDAVARERREVVRLDVGRGHAEAEVRVDLEPRELLLELVGLVEQRAQAGCVELGDRAAVARGEVLRALDELGPLRARLLGAGAEVGEVPADVLGASSVVATGGTLVEGIRRSGGAGRRSSRSRLSASSSWPASPMSYQPPAKR